MRAPCFCAVPSALRSWAMLSSTSINWMATFALATLCAAKKPKRTASAARANGVPCPGSNSATGTGGPCFSFSAGASAGAVGVTVPGFASSGVGIGVTTGGSAGRGGGVSGAGVAGAGACGAGAGAVGAGAGGGVRGAGTFAGGVAQENNAAAINESRKRGSRRMKEEKDWLADRLVDASGVAAQELAPGALYVVATPIGNLADLTVRAWWVLSHVDAIAAEDTRVTRHLLDRYHIEIAPARLIAAHEHNERGAAERVLALLHEGLRVALVSDA